MEFLHTKTPLCGIPGTYLLQCPCFLLSRKYAENTAEQNQKILTNKDGQCWGFHFRGVRGYSFLSLGFFSKGEEKHTQKKEQKNVDILSLSHPKPFGRQEIPARKRRKIPPKRKGRPGLAAVTLFPPLSSTQPLYQWRCPDRHS